MKDRIDLEGLARLPNLDAGALLGVRGHVGAPPTPERVSMTRGVMK
jgi:hypothetical protein